MSRIGWERVEDLQEQAEFESESGFRGRLFFLRLMVVLIFGFLLGYVVFLQQTQGRDLAAQAADRQFATLTTDAPRGEIFDRNGLPLAENLPSYDVTIVPAFLPTDSAERTAVYERLSLLTGIPVTNTIQQEALVETADPEQISVASRLAELYGANQAETLDNSGVVENLPDSIAEIVQTYSYAQYVPAIVATVPYTTARAVEQESVFMPGVQVAPKPVRDYPTGEFTSHLIGFMGPLPDQSYRERGYEADDRVGLFGIESSLENQLSGIKGERTIEVDSTGRLQRQIGLATDPIPGRNLTLTLDYDLQIKATNILREFMARRRNFPPDPREIEQGVVVALNPKTGEILAMVNEPTFDNNRFATEIDVQYYLSLERNDYRPLLNNAIGGQYPPGSVYKLVTGAAALQEGIVSAGRRLDTPGSIVIPNRFAPNDPGRAQRFVCWIWNTFQQEDDGSFSRREHDSMNMYEAMSNSCDIYFYKVAGGFDQDTEDRGRERVETLGIDRLNDYAAQFGFGRVQGIELPAEAPGNNPSRAWKSATYGEPWSTGDDYNTSIGQGFVTATPLQIAQMAAVVANGGFLFRPTIVHHMTDADGNVVVTDTDGREILARQSLDGSVSLQDTDGNPIDLSEINKTIAFDASGNYVLQPDLLNVVNVDRRHLDVVAEGMRLTNLEGGTAGGLAWDENMTFGTINGDVVVEVAGKTGTAEYCDNIAIRRDWCADEPDEIQPTHAWYVAYAPYEDPEIVVVAFMFNAGEGSEWAAPVVRGVMQAYFSRNY